MAPSPQQQKAPSQSAVEAIRGNSYRSRKGSLAGSFVFSASTLKMKEVLDGVLGFCKSIGIYIAAFAAVLLFIYFLQPMVNWYESGRMKQDEQFFHCLGSDEYIRLSQIEMCFDQTFHSSQK